MEHGQIGRNSGLLSLKQHEATNSYNAATPAAPPPLHTLNEVSEYQRNLHANSIHLAMRLANLLSYLDGNPSNEAVPLTQAKESALIAAIITRINNTNQYVTACNELVNMLEVRMGIA